MSNPFTDLLIDIARAGMQAPASPPIDPRDDDPTKTGIFRSHNCWKCNDGEKPCARGHTLNCEYPHARND